MLETKLGVFRSFLFAPANHPRRTEKAFTIGADAVILDLEDACAISEKVASRPKVVQAMQLALMAWFFRKSNRLPRFRPPTGSCRSLSANAASNAAALT